MLISRDPRTSPAALKAALVLAWLLAPASTPAQASPISAPPHHRDLLTILKDWERTGADWLTGQQQSLTGLGHPRHAAVHPSSAPGQPKAAGSVHPLPAALTPVDGLLPSTPLVHLLEQRRSLDPARFDQLHPRIGPLLAEDVANRAAHLKAAAERISAADLDTRPDPAPHAHHLLGHRHPTEHLLAHGLAHHSAHPSISPVPAPEPGASTVALALIGSAALARRLRRRP